MVASMTGAFKGALTRLSGGEASDTASPAQPGLFPADPTRSFAPGDDDEHDTGPSQLPLGAMMEDAARAMKARADAIRNEANRLNSEISARIEGEVTLRTQGARVAIGLVWAAVAGRLYVLGLNARAADAATLPSGMPVPDAMVLAQTFGTLAAIAVGVAFLIATMTSVFGRGDNKKVRTYGETLGLAIADAAHDFDRTLTELRHAMDRRRDPADAVKDLSRAHITALEACVYFREMAFLTNAQGQQAHRYFKGFLSRPASNPHPAPVLVLGAILGAFMFKVYLVLTTPAVPNPDAVPLAITSYPWALALLFLGGLAYAAAGIIFSVLGPAITGDTGTRAREEALDALRGAFTSREAPRPADIIRRIDDAVDVFRARVGGRGAGTSRDHAAGDFDPASNHSGGHLDENGLEPSWRNRDSSARFVDSGFQAAPKSWRVDFFNDPERREPGAKRDQLFPKNRDAD